jgi:hypothetical protein
MDAPRMRATGSVSAPSSAYLEFAARLALARWIVSSSVPRRPTGARGETMSRSQSKEVQEAAATQVP